MFRLNIIGEVRSSGTGSGTTTSGESGTITSWENGQPQGRPRRPPALDLAQIKAPPVASRQELEKCKSGLALSRETPKILCPTKHPKAHQQRSFGDVVEGFHFHPHSQEEGVLWFHYITFHLSRRFNHVLLNHCAQLKSRGFSFCVVL